MYIVYTKTTHTHSHVSQPWTSKWHLATQQESHIVKVKLDDYADTQRTHCEHIHSSQSSQNILLDGGQAERMKIQLFCTFSLVFSYFWMPMYIEYNWHWFVRVFSPNMLYLHLRIDGEETKTTASDQSRQKPTLRSHQSHNAWNKTQFHATEYFHSEFFDIWIYLGLLYIDYSKSIWMIQFYQFHR